MKRHFAFYAGGFAIVFAAIVAFVFFFSASGKAALLTPPAMRNVATPQKLWHCGMHPQVVQDHPGDCPICHMALTPIAESGSEVHIDARISQNMGVRTAKVTRGKLDQTLRTVGILSLPEPGLRDVSLKVNGFVQKLYANQEGMHVSKGDPLLEVYSPELLVAVQELFSAAKAVHALPENAAAELKAQANRFLDTAKRKLQLWDVSEQDIAEITRSNSPPQAITLRSPVSGDIEEKMVVEGGAVTAGTKLLRIADHGTMWLLLNVYSDSISSIKMGEEVTADIEGISDKPFSGQVDFIYPHLDHMTRTLKVRVALANPAFELRPGMFASATIHLPGESDVAVVPREAVIDSGTAQTVFIDEGNGHFSARQVRVGRTGDNDRMEILAGLSEGEAVVTSGQFLMDVESRRNEAVRKLSGGATPSMPIAMTPMAADEKPQSPAKVVQVYCPMVKATWLQIGDVIRNPYMGSEMPHCGQVRAQIDLPEEKSPLKEVVDRYLLLAGGLEKDTLAPESLKGLKDSSEKLPNEFSELKGAIIELAQKSDVKSARDSFKKVSDALAGALGKHK